MSSKGALIMLTKRYFLELFLDAYIDRYFALALDNDDINKPKELKYASGELKILRKMYKKLYGEKSYKLLKRHIRYIAQKEVEDCYIR